MIDSISNSFILSMQGHIPPAPGTTPGPEALCPAGVLVAPPAEALTVLVVLPVAGELWEVCGAHGLGSGSLFSVREGWLPSPEEVLLTKEANGLPPNWKKRKNINKHVVIFQWSHIFHISVPQSQTIRVRHEQSLGLSLGTNGSPALGRHSAWAPEYLYTCVVEHCSPRECFLGCSRLGPGFSSFPASLLDFWQVPMSKKEISILKTGTDIAFK